MFSLMIYLQEFYDQFIYTFVYSTQDTIYYNQ